MITIAEPERQTGVLRAGLVLAVTPDVAFGRPKTVLSSLTGVQKVVLCVLLLVLGGCTNSKLVIGPLYNRLDDQIRGEFHKLGYFYEQQSDFFERRVGTFHVWHRQMQLPLYAALLNDIQKALVDPAAIENLTVGEWIDRSERFSKSVRVCHPVNFSYPLMQTLTDKQVNFIERRFANERRKNFDRYLSSTPPERRERRRKNIIKWASRVGFEFNDAQIKLLDETLARQISLRRQYYREVDMWNNKLFKIARDQLAPDFNARMAAQVQKLWRLLESSHPQEWKANRELWRDFGYKFVQSMTRDQRVTASAWLNKMGKTLVEISKDEPSFKPEYDPAHGCLQGRTG